MRMCMRLAASLSLLAGVVCGQSIYGTLTGTVSDSSGAVVPGVSITVQNESSGDVRKTVTNGSGYFDVSALPAGIYTVIAETGGFTKYRVTGVTLTSAENKTMKIDLAIATSSEHVVVVAATDQLVTTDSGEKSALVTSKELSNLTLLGRNAAELVKILPGASMVANGGVNGQAYSGENYGINGAGLGGNQGGNGGTNINGQYVDITMDGAHTYDPGAPGGATPVNPNVEMIEEIKVLTSNFNAENTQSGVVMNTVSKSGGRDFHGEGYLVARNAVMNAADWANNAEGVKKPDSNYYFPGANIGGPVLLPFTKFNRKRDKLFFFEGFEFYKQTIDGGIDRAFVPTLAERNGDFTGASSMGPLQANLASIPSGMGFAGGILPKNLIDPGAQVLMNLYPKPNIDPLTNNGYNWEGALIANQNSWQSLSRVDYSISDNTKLFVRYNAQREQQNQPTGLWGGVGTDNALPNPSNILGRNASDTTTTSLTHVFSPTMTSETTFSYNRVAFPDSPTDPSKIQRKESGFPYQGIYKDSYTNPIIGVSWDATLPVFGRNGYDFSYGPDHNEMYANSGDWDAAENLSKVIGTHTMKFGYYFEKVGHDQTNWTQSNGYFEFGTWGSPTGNAYADMLAGSTGEGYLENSLYEPGNIGERWHEFYAQDHWKVLPRLTVDYGIRLSHMPPPYDETGAGMAIFDPARYDNSPGALGQNTGLEWHAIDPSVPNSGVKSRLFFYSPRFGLAWDVFGNGKTVLRGGWGKYRTSLGTQTHNATVPLSTAQGANTTSACNMYNSSCATWAQIETFAANTNLGYRSGIGVVDPQDDEMQLVTSYSFSIDQELPGKFVLETSYVGNQGNYGATSYDINPVPIGTVIPAGVSSPYSAYLPMANYGDIEKNANLLKSEYDSLQASLRRNVGFFNLQANYTWSKLMADNNINASLPGLGLPYYWGISTSNRPQVLSLAYTFTVPKMELGSRFANGAANGWQVSGITQWESGPDLIAQSNNFTFADANNSSNSTAGVQLQPLMVCNPTANLKPNQFVNPACFAPAPPGVMGTGEFPYIPGPAFWNSDLAATKNFAFKERQNLQLRFSAFNFLNHPLITFHPGDQNLVLNYDSSGHLTNPNFGYAMYKTGHRVIELSVKYMF